MPKPSKQLLFDAVASELANGRGIHIAKVSVTYHAHGSEYCENDDSYYESTERTTITVTRRPNMRLRSDVRAVGLPTKRLE